MSKNVELALRTKGTTHSLHGLFEWHLNHPILYCTYYIRLSKEGETRGFFALFLVQFCGNFYFKLQYCSFTKPNGLWCLEISSNFNALCSFVILFCTVFIRNAKFNTHRENWNLRKNKEHSITTTYIMYTAQEICDDKYQQIIY